MALVRKYGFKFYEILNMLNGYFTPTSTEFFDYCLTTLDKHNSFLRSRFCKRDEPLEDYDISYGIEWVLCAFNVSFEDSHFVSKDRSKLKMQYAMEPSTCSDCCVHYWCETCALCQEYRELQNRGYDMSLGKMQP